jgi:cytochrome P450 family 150 subfamily A5
LIDFEAVDFFRDDAVVADPYPYFEALRAQCPIQREPHHDVLMVTGYDEAVEVLQDPGRFSSCLSVTGPFPGFPVPLDGAEDVSSLIEEHRDTLPMSDHLPLLDPPAHTAHRALLMRLITPKRLKENEARMWELADRMLDTFLATGEGEFVTGFAAPFTLLVIADLLGIPEAEQEEFLGTLGQGVAERGPVGSTSEGTMAHSPLEFLYARFAPYVEDRRANPRDDVLTGLATATFPDGSTPSVDDVVRVAAIVFAAGQETTVRLLSAAVRLIAEDPDLQRLLRRERDRIPNFIEEMLRLESPIKGDFRLATVPTTVGGVDVPAGTILMLVNGAVNRDPRRFDDPAAFDMGRPNVRQHLAFGRGIHTCPGAPLARAEGRAGIERLLDRTTEITLSERVHGPAGARRFDYLPTFMLRGLTHLNLEFSTGSGGAAR